ncbi:enoyl-CoA-hydratase DpgB [Nonomuraea sp. NPDC005650]|uniref:enoyl-CoA-hydratase DpgB n=1 Tax=Nonomuraea sp. NPDC005650 TaxID=3157045 RepID=UPI0033A35D82
MVTGDALAIRIDGALPVSPESVVKLRELCDRADDHEGGQPVVVHVSGTPADSRPEGLTVALVNKWEQALRRLERLATPTIAVASGDCGGKALEALLATDYRIATPRTRFLMPLQEGAAWPGMATFRIAQQAGAARARRSVLFGMPITAADALSLHLVDELVADPAAALARTAELAGAVSGQELAIRRQLLLNAETTSFEDALGTHLAACDRVLRRAAAVELTP